MQDDPIRRRTGGRSARIRQAVHDATLDSLRTHGVDGVSVRRIAEASGVHETTVYRRWGNREGLVIDALLVASDNHLPIPDTGSIEDDMIAFAMLARDYLESPAGNALVRTMAGTEDGDTMAAARDDFWEARLVAAHLMIERAMERGELGPDTDGVRALELLIAPLHFRVLMTRQPVDDASVKQYVGIVLNGLRQSAGSTDHVRIES